jgi:hypothetical protein
MKRREPALGICFSYDAPSVNWCLKTLECPGTQINNVKQATD